VSFMSSVPAGVPDVPTSGPLISELAGGSVSKILHLTEHMVSAGSELNRTILDYQLSAMLQISSMSRCQV
jgi:hypothetical protein